MNRANEFVVGIVILLSLATIIAGALWLSETRIGATESMLTARFRTVGGLGVGDPVILRGVRVGRVEAIRLVQDDWVHADMRFWEGVDIPSNPAVINASASLFGEWSAQLISRDQPIEDPNVDRLIREAEEGVVTIIPGATLPDISQLTTQASRIAGDIATVAGRVQSAFDSTAVIRLRSAIADLRGTAERIAELTNEQADVIGDVGKNFQAGSQLIMSAAEKLETTLGRVDSATNQGELQTIMTNMAATSTDVRGMSADLRSLTDAVGANHESLVRVLIAADSVMTRAAQRKGTLGLLLGDSTLYREATLTLIQMRQLLADIQANPRKYFKFSVF